MKIVRGVYRSYEMEVMPIDTEEGATRKFGAAPSIPKQSLSQVRS